ncbi:transposase [Streptomyces sp. NPDC054864]
MGEHCRSCGGLYAAMPRGRIDDARLRRGLAEVPLPRASDGRMVLATDVTCWLRPDAPTSPERILCHTYGRGKEHHIPVPGWPYSIICALEPGRSSWTAPMGDLRLAAGEDTATVTARQLRDLLQRLTAAKAVAGGRPLHPRRIANAGYDTPRLGCLLADLPVQVLARMRSDRVCAELSRHGSRTPRTDLPGTAESSSSVGQPDTWNTPDTESITETRLYDTARAPQAERCSWAAPQTARPPARPATR